MLCYSRHPRAVASAIGNGRSSIAPPGGVDACRPEGVRRPDLKLGIGANTARRRTPAPVDAADRRPLPNSRFHSSLPRHPDQRPELPDWPANSTSRPPACSPAPDAPAGPAAGLRGQFSPSGCRMHEKEDASCVASNFQRNLPVAFLSAVRGLPAGADVASPKRHRSAALQVQDGRCPDRRA
jgi:hypothetical protein